MPTVPVAESSRHENVIIGDDVVLSSTQLSKSIDKLGGDSQRTRRTFTSLPTFPCCQVRFKAHGNSTFPLFFENNQLVEHFENISMHDLLKAIKQRIKDDGNINNKMLLLRGKEFGKDRRWIKGNQWATHFRHNFPVKSKQSKSHSFPCRSVAFSFLTFNQMEISSFINTMNMKRSAHLEEKEELQNYITTLISQSSTKPKTEEATFPIKAKRINKQFPLLHKVQQPTCGSERLQINLISKSLQDTHVNPKSCINILNKPKSKFPLGTKSMQKTIKEFPLKSLEPLEPCLILNQSKSKTFPVTSQLNQSKFPYTNTPLEISLNLTVKRIRQTLHLNKIYKTLQMAQNFNAANDRKLEMNLGTNVKFPLKYVKINLNAEKHQRCPFKEQCLKFPLNQISTTNQQLSKPETKQFLLNMYDNQCKLAKVMTFPLKFPENFGTFPVEHHPKGGLILILSVHDVKRKFQSNKISKSLQTTLSLNEIVNSKTFTKFPLKDRLVKKFYRKFPSERDIPIPHEATILRKEKISIDQQQRNFTKLSNDNATSRNNVNIFKIITTAEASPSMTPDLYKQHWSFCQQRNTTVDDNEKHASQVQFTQQVHVENPVGIPPMIPRPSQTQDTPSTHNDDDRDLKILPAIDAKNISLTTTKTATEVGQYSENFEHHDAIINIRDDGGGDDDDDASISSGATLSQNIINSSFNHRHYNEDEHERERERNVGGILRASTPPMSAITSVQNTERLVVLHDHDHDIGGDLCNPQVAQIVECSSDVRDTFNTTVDNGSRTKLNFSITGNILDKNQNESSPPPPQIPESLLLTPSSSSSGFITPNAAAAASISDRICSTSLKENYSDSSEILPKYSVLELSESNAINCPEIDCTKIIGVTDQISRQSSEKERAAVVSYEITNDQVEATNINAIFKYYTNDEQHLLDNLKIDEIFDLDDLIEIDEMKFEMKRSKGTLPSTTSGTARDIGKPSETAASSFNRSKPYATTAALRGPSALISSTVPTSSVTRPTAMQRPASDHSSSGITPSSAALRGTSDRISSTASTNSISRPTATRRLSSDYNSIPTSPTYSTSKRSISSIPTSSASQRASSNLTSPRSSFSTNYGSDGDALSASPATNRYTNDNTTAATPTAAPKLKYTRRPTSGALLSLDLPRYTSSSESLPDSSATINRGVSLDTTTALDVLPERTRLRRQRRFRPQDSQDEDRDPIERLNRLKARISASLSEVKGVLKQYSTEGEGENETQTSNTLTPSAASPLTLEKVEENAGAEKNEENGPVTFRFVKKIRRRSFFTEDDEAEQEAGKDEVDKSQSVPYLQKDTSPLKLPLATDEISQESKSESSNFRNAAFKVSPTPVIKVEDNDEQSQDIGPKPRASQKSEMGIIENQKFISTGAENLEGSAQKVSPKSNIFPQNAELDLSKRPSANEQHQVEQLVNNKTNDKKNDVKVNESKTGNTEVLAKPEMSVSDNKTEKVAKKVENIKIKSNKNGSQQREIKAGKSASKIPQRIETKSANNVNEPKMETKTTASTKKTESNENYNEVKLIEILKNNNVKDIPAKASAVDIKKTHTVGELQEAKDVVPTPQESRKQEATFNDTRFEEATPKRVVTDIKVEDKKGNEISTKETMPQAENQFKTKENDLRIGKDDYNKDKKESSPKPTKLEIEVTNEKSITTEEICRTKDLSPKPKVVEVKGLDTKSKSETTNNMENYKDVSTQPTISMAGPPKPLIKPKVIETKQIQTADSDLLEKEITTEGPVKLRKKVSTKTNDPLRRASLAAVEGSKIEPPVEIATPAKIQRRPSDSEAIVKKKLITTKTTTSGSVEEVTPKLKIVKVKRSSIKKPISPSASSDDTRHQLATTKTEAISTNNRNGQRITEAASLSSTKANKSIQGDKNKDVTMPNDEMLTQMPLPQPPANDTKSLGGQINRTQLLINEAATNLTPSSSLTRKTIELDASSSQATIENAKATTTNLAASKFEKSDGGAMLANSKPTLVSATTASAANGPKQTITIPPQEDLHDLLQQEAVIFIQPAKKDPNELKADENNKEEGPHKNLSANKATPANLEASAKQLNEPLEIPQQQVVNRTDIVVIKSHDDSVQVIATPPQQSTTSIDSANLASTASSSPVDQHTTPSVTTNQQTQQKQQQHSPTTTTTTIEDATTKTNDSPQISISSQVDTTADTQSQAAAQTTSIQDSTHQVASKGLEGDLLKMPEFQLTPAPVQTAEIPNEPHKKTKTIKKVIRHKKADGQVDAIEESVIPEINLDPHKDETATASSCEDLSETTEQSTEESSSQSEAGPAADKPKKVRKAKKKVIIKRQKRRLSVCGDTFFNHNSTEEAVNAEVETLEKPISFVSDEEPEDEPVVEEKKPLKSCISKKEYEIGDEVLYGERVKKTQIKWKRAHVKERTSSISYILDIDGNDVWSHISNLKKYTNRKVNFGTKEYLEIDYEQLAEDEERAERVKQRTFSIWNMV